MVLIKPYLVFDMNKSKLKLFVPFKVLENIKEPKALNMYIDVVSILSITNYDESFLENEILSFFNNNAFA